MFPLRSLAFAFLAAATAVLAGTAQAQASGRPTERPHGGSSLTRLARRGSTEPIRIVVSLEQRRLWVLGRRDTLLSAPVAVGMGSSLRYGGQRWVFRTPRGVRTVLAKSADPIWVPPDWLYADAAATHGLRLARLESGAPVRLRDGRLLAMRRGVAGLIDIDGSFDALPVDEHIVFDNTLFIPPPDSRNRRIPGQLGKYRLDLGDGYLLHGTPYQSSIGAAVTHGCIRLRDGDIAWLYTHVPVGTRVHIQ